MSKPNNSIKSIQTPDNTSHEIIPDRLGNGSYVAGLPTLNKDSTLALEEDAIQLLSSSSVRITDLDTGIYKTSKGTKTLYYNGTTSTDSLSIGSSKSTMLLFVNKSDISATGTIVQKWIWHIEYVYPAQNSKIYLGEVYYISNDGVVSTNNGSYKELTYAEFGYLSGLTSNVQTQLNGKQETLVSGTNIKTINGNSVLGNGDITVGGGTPTTVKVDGTSITSNNEADLKTMNGNYNANTNKLATASDLPTTASDVGALPDTTTFVSSVNGNSGAITNVEKTTNKVTSWSSTVTDTNYPSEKLVYSSKLGRPQTEWETGKSIGSLNQGDYVYTASEIDRACIVTIRGSFGSTTAYLQKDKNGTNRIYQSITGENSIVFILSAGDSLVLDMKGTVYWADVMRVNFGGIVNV